MDEQSQTVGVATKPAGGARHDLLLMFVLMAVVGLLHLWVLTHTTVAARDSIAFIRYAWQLEHYPWPEVLRGNLHHPGFPVAIAAVSWALRSCGGSLDADTMRLAAQLANSLAAVLLVVPLYFLGKIVFERRTAFWGVLIYQCLPSSNQLLSDGLSEGVFLLWAASAILAAVIAHQRSSVLGFALAGVFSGLAYLTRPEGILIAPAMALVLLLGQLLPSSRRPWRSTLAESAALLGALTVVAAPYIATIGALTNKTTGREILHTARDVPSQATAARQPPLALVWSVWTDAYRVGQRSGSVPWAFRGFTVELLKGFNYVALPAVIFGLWHFRRRWGEPESWLLGAPCLAQALAVLRVASVMGYVSERHVQLIVMTGCLWAAAGLLALPGWWQERGWRLPRWSAATWATILPGLVVAVGLPSALKPLHANRQGHREVGRWLAEHARPTEHIVDPFCWAEYYAGRAFGPPGPPRPPKEPPDAYYIVLETTSNPHERLPMIPGARALAERATLIHLWQPATPRKDRPGVAVYFLPAGQL
ncbi:MAG: glycosyltransferase family 39 protein [Gemmataceae bacterium]|nr:glycosyltransferase family 39 protein [Gemmataceae bacterium]